MKGDRGLGECEEQSRNKQKTGEKATGGEEGPQKSPGESHSSLSYCKQIVYNWDFHFTDR